MMRKLLLCSASIVVMLGCRISSEDLATNEIIATYHVSYDRDLQRVRASALLEYDDCEDCWFSSDDRVYLEEGDALYLSLGEHAAHPFMEVEDCDDGEYEVEADSDWDLSGEDIRASLTREEPDPSAMSRVRLPEDFEILSPAPWSVIKGEGIDVVWGMDPGGFRDAIEIRLKGKCIENTAFQTSTRVNGHHIPWEEIDFQVAGSEACKVRLEVERIRRGEPSDQLSDKSFISGGLIRSTLIVLAP